MTDCTHTPNVSTVCAAWYISPHAQSQSLHLVRWVQISPSGPREPKEILLGSTHNHSGVDESRSPIRVSLRDLSMKHKEDREALGLRNDSCLPSERM